MKRSEYYIIVRLEDDKMGLSQRLGYSIRKDIYVEKQKGKTYITDGTCGLLIGSLQCTLKDISEFWEVSALKEKYEEYKQKHADEYKQKQATYQKLLKDLENGKISIVIN